MRNDALVKALADCKSPDTLLAAILKYHPDLSAPVDVETIARSVGITDFRDLDVDGFTSAMMADTGKTRGVILSAAGLAAQRRRFAVAHQLGHFLLSDQRGDRQCTARDLGENRRDTPRRKEEMQANRFAAGLLMPKPWFQTLVEGLGKPTVMHLPDIAAAYNVPLEVAASRYVDLTPGMYALIFVKNGVVRLVKPSRSFPALWIRPGGAARPSVLSAMPRAKIAWAMVEVRDWIVLDRDTRPPKVAMQILSKENGFQLVMLFVDAAAERRADEEAEKFATERPKFGRPTAR